MIALLEAYKNGLLNPKNWKSNIIAGLIVGIVALPLSLAFAIASGAQPEQGIYTAIIAGFIVGIFGGTRVQISGPTGAFVVILASITAKFGIAGLQIATIMAGLMLTAMGIMQLGNALKFIPHPVIVGFTSGIGVVIFVGQLKNFFGLPVSLALDAPFHEKLVTLISALPQLDAPTTLLSLVSIVLLIALPRVITTIPAPLIVMLGATGARLLLNASSVATIGSMFGTLPQQLPSFAIPATGALNMYDLIGPACTIALLGAIESLLSAAAADSMAGTKHNANQELIGQGLANILAPFWGGFASTGAIARTATSLRHGGNSPLAALVHSAVLLLILLIFAPYAVHIPFAALAAILCAVAFNMSDVPEFLHITKHAPWYDVAVLIITFLLTVFADLVIAVAIGVIIALLFAMMRLYQTTPPNERDLPHLKHAFNIHTMTQVTADNGIIYTIEGPLFFGVAEAVEHALATTHTDPKFIIIRLHKVPFIDMTGLATLAKVIKQYHKRSVAVYLCEANARVTHKIRELGLLKLVKGNQIFESLESIMTVRKS